MRGDRRKGASSFYGDPNMGSSEKVKLPGLKEWRERRGMSQQELALAAGLVQQSVSRASCNVVGRRGRMRPWTPTRWT